MEVSLHPDGVAGDPLNATVLDPWLDPKFAPVIVTAVPTGPEVGKMLAIVGGDITLKVKALLQTPPSKTFAVPLVDPAATVASTCVLFQPLTTP
jgi:uncharacterized membrane protein